MTIDMTMTTHSGQCACRVKQEADCLFAVGCLAADNTMAEEIKRVKSKTSDYFAWSDDKVDVMRKMFFRNPVQSLLVVKL